MTPGKVRIGVVGLGYMGTQYARLLREGGVPRAELTAVCNRHTDKCRPFQDRAAVFADRAALFQSGLVDAVIVATPHPDHPASGIEALRHGLHVLVDKPLAAQKADAERLLAAHVDRRQVFAAMFQFRTDPRFVRARALLHQGALGPIQRVHWILTDWFRPDAYYASAPWRGTWKGEGGGVLLNQCPHQLDLLPWLLGMPVRVRAFCQFGKYHSIEVEDEATAYLEWADGATGVFVTSTGEAPGTNRLEIAGDKGRLLVEPERLLLSRNRVPASQCCRRSNEAFPVLEKDDEEIRFTRWEDGHRLVLQNFTEAILDGAPLIAPAAEGLRSLELANAMLLSSWQERAVALPLDAEVYRRALAEKINAPG